MQDGSPSFTFATTLPPLLPHQQEYFEGDASDHSGEPPTAKGLAVFRDPNQTKRTATSINWHPEGPAKIAVSYSILKFQDPRFMNAYMPKKVSRLCPPAARCAASLESLFRVRASDSSTASSFVKPCVAHVASFVLGVGGAWTLHRGSEFECVTGKALATK